MEITTLNEEQPKPEEMTEEMTTPTPEEPERNIKLTPANKRVILGGSNSALMAMLAGSVARNRQSLTSRLDAERPTIRRRGRGADPQAAVDAQRELLKQGHNPHQGKREKERRVRQMARDAAKQAKREASNAKPE